MAEKLTKGKRAIINFCFSSLSNHPDNWEFTLYTAKHKSLNIEIWIANRYYATRISGNGFKIGGNEGDKEPWYQRGWRRRLVNLVDNVSTEQFLLYVKKVEP